MGRSRQAIQAVVQAERSIGKAKTGFTKGTNEAGDSLVRAGQDIQAKNQVKAEKEIKDRDALVKANDAKVASYLEDMPDGAEFPKVPKNLEASIGKWTVNKRKEYADHANALRNLDPTEPTYQDHVAEMNKITQSFVDLDVNLDKFLENKNIYMDTSQAEDTPGFSRANDPESMKFLNSVYTDGSSMDIESDGTLLFGEGKTSMADFPKTIEVSAKAGVGIMKLATASYNEGYKSGVDIYNDQDARTQLKMVFKGLGRNGLKSLATDSEDLFGQDLGISNDLIQNPEREDELEEILLNAFSAYLKEKHDSGIRNKEKANQQKFNDKQKFKPPTKPKNSLDKFFTE